MNRWSVLSRARTAATLGRASAGFTLVEMVVSIALLSIVVGSLVSVVLSSQRSYDRQANVNRSQENLRAAESSIVTILRAAKADPYETGSALLDPDPLNHGKFDNVRVVSDFNPADGDFSDPMEDVLFYLMGDTLKVRWQAGTEALSLAWPITLLDFDYFDTAGTAITDPAAVGTATRARVTIVADKGPRTDALDRLQSWVYMRN